MYIFQNDTLKYFEAKVEAEQEIQRLREQVQVLRSQLNIDKFAKDDKLMQEIA